LSVFGYLGLINIPFQDQDGSTTAGSTPQPAVIITITIDGAQIFIAAADEAAIRNW
jgi:hypothetical protein